MNKNFTNDMKISRMTNENLTKESVTNSLFIRAWQKTYGVQAYIVWHRLEHRSGRAQILDHLQLVEDDSTDQGCETVLGGVRERSPL